MHPSIHYIIGLWGQLRWYYKILVVLIVLRITNTIYRVVFESKESKKKRENVEKEYDTINLQKVNLLKRKMKEVELQSKQVPTKNEAFTGIHDSKSPDKNVLHKTLAIISHVSNRLLKGIHDVHVFLKQLLNAFLLDFVAPKIYGLTKHVKR